MLKQVSVLLIVLLTACTEIPAAPPVTESNIQNVAIPSTRLAAVDSPRWVETEMSGVKIGAWLPVGWQADTTGGLTMVEHMGSLHSGEVATGITVRIFVPEVEALVADAGDHENLAFAVLESVAISPELTDGAQVSEPVAFRWNDHHAAYYLFAAPDDVDGLVVALAMADEHKIVVANIAAPRAEMQRLQAVLPQLIGELQINRQRLNGEFISALPDPLVFPSQ